MTVLSFSLENRNNELVCSNDFVILIPNRKISVSFTMEMIFMLSSLIMKSIPFA